MPVFELRCATCDVVQDCHLWKWDDPNPACSVCGAPRERIVSRFGLGLTGSMSKYMDKKREGAQDEGFWAFQKRNTVDGQPVPVYIDNMEQLKAFNKSEGLAAPGEVPTNASISADGRQIISNGLSGQWGGGVPPMPARLKQMVEMPAEMCTAGGATTSPRMPDGHGMHAEAIAPEVAAEMMKSMGT